MKKSTLAVFFILTLLLVACSSKDNSHEVKESEEQGKEENEGINVDKGLFNVELNLPASLFEGEDIDTVIADAEEKGIKVTKNENGSLTYKMTKAQHKEIMAELEKSLVETIEEIKNSDDFSSIKDVIYNKDFSEFTLVVDKNEYENSFDGFAVFGLGLSGCFYQVFNGADPENYNVKITIKDEATQEVISEVNYPGDLNTKE